MRVARIVPAASDWDVSQAPQGESLIAEDAARMCTTLVDCRQWRRKVEWRCLQIQHAPTACANVSIPFAIHKSGRQQVSRAATSEIAQSSSDVGIGKVHQAISRQNEIGSGKWVSSEVACQEGSAHARVLAYVTGNKLLNNVHTDISIHRQGDWRRPVEITAWSIEQCCDLELSQEVHQIAEEHRSALSRGTRPRNRLRTSPGVLSEDTLEDSPMPATACPEPEGEFARDQDSQDAESRATWQDRDSVSASPALR